MVILTIMSQYCKTRPTLGRGLPSKVTLPHPRLPWRVTLPLQGKVNPSLRPSQQLWVLGPRRAESSVQLDLRRPPPAKLGQQRPFVLSAASLCRTKPLGRVWLCGPTDCSTPASLSSTISSLLLGEERGQGPASPQAPVPVKALCCKSTGLCAEAGAECWP